MKVASKVLILALLSFSASAEYQPPRTAGGKPSFQGVWTNASITTLERPGRYPQLIIPAAEVTKLTQAHPQVVRQNTDDNLDHADGLLDGSDLARGRGYNAFWIDPGREFGLVKGTRRSSWIVEPVNGKIPFNKQGRQWMTELVRRKEDNFDGPEMRPPAERCLIIGGRVGPPMVNGLYNNNYQIIQTDDHLAIWVEMVSHVRIVRINGKPSDKSLTSLFGDSIAHWQGDTLVVESSQFAPLQLESQVPLSAEAKVIEKFTRVSEQQIYYEFEITDPSLYTQTWRGEMSLNRQQDAVYEYACHEGNYALEGILGGARYQERHPR